MKMIRVAGVDPTQGGLKRTAGTPGSRDVGDDFAMCTSEFPDDFHRPPSIIHIFRANGMTSKQMSAYIHRAHKFFGYSLIVMDPGGGGYSIRDNLREPKQDTGAGIFDSIPIISEDDDQMRGMGQKILALFSRGDSKIKKAHHGIPGESYLPNKMHAYMVGALEAEPQQIIFPEEWVGWAKQNLIFNDPDQMREFLMMSTLTGRDKVAAEIDLALFQMAVVERELDDKSELKKDKDGMFSFVSKQKKDAGYALLYAYFAARMWIDCDTIRGQKKSTRSDFFVEAAEI